MPIRDRWYEIHGVFIRDRIQLRIEWHRHWVVDRMHSLDVTRK
jgi:hypothetical protein